MERDRAFILTSPLYEVPAESGMYSRLSRTCYCLFACQLDPMCVTGVSRGLRSETTVHYLLEINVNAGPATAGDPAHSSCKFTARHTPVRACVSHDAY